MSYSNSPRQVKVMSLNQVIEVKEIYVHKITMTHERHVVLNYQSFNCLFNSLYRPS